MKGHFLFFLLFFVFFGPFLKATPIDTVRQNTEIDVPPLIESHPTKVERLTYLELSQCDFFLVGDEKKRNIW